MLLAALAAEDGVHISSVDPVRGDVCYVEMHRTGRTVGTAGFKYHTGTKPWEIGAVLSQQIQAASGADPRFATHVLADQASKEYPGGSADAAALLRALLGGRYELYMETYLDAAMASGNRLAATMMELERREGQSRPTAAVGNSGCMVLLLSTAVAGLIAATVGSVSIKRFRRRSV
ncbi:hypothetical protein [Nocardia sp. NPDC004722]